MNRPDVRELADRFLDLLFPRKCAVCHEMIGYDQMLCDDCGAGLGVIGENCCEICGKPPDSCVCGVYPQRCEACACAVEYYESAKDIISEFKFNGQSSLARPMAKLMAQAVELRFPDVRFDVIAAAPMRRRAAAKRGYNQSELLARELSRLLGISWRKKALVKLRDTAHQSSLGAKLRLVNLIGAIGVNRRFDPSGLTVLLVDDIATTGATLNECAGALLSGGAKAVYAAVFAAAVLD